MGKNLGKNISKDLNDKSLHNGKIYATDVLKITLKRVIQKAAEATSDLIGNNVADRIAKVARTSPQNNLETVTNVHEKEIIKERYHYLQRKDRK